MHCIIIYFDLGPASHYLYLLTMEKDDVYWMTEALKMAELAKTQGEVPVGAVLIGPEGLLAKTLNSREKDQNPLGHAELQALHEAAKIRQSWRLSDCTLYVTLEPCIMCAGAIQQARLLRVVYGAKDPKAGGTDSLYQILQDPRLNHQTLVTSGVLENKCSSILTQFFQEKRDQQKSDKKDRIYRERSTVIVFHQNQVLGFNAVDPTSKKDYFFLPGGAIEEGETPSDSARRECLEETGYEVDVDQSSEYVREYSFLWNGKNYHCKTYFYLGFLKDAHAASNFQKDADYNLGPSWQNTQNIEKLFNYTPEILMAVQKLHKLYKKKIAQNK